MKILLIDTVGQPNLVAFADTATGHVLDLLWNADSDEAERILPAVREVLGDEGKADAVACISGPGRFTSTRIGVAVANALSFAWEARSTSLDRIAFARELLSGNGTGKAVAVPSEKGDYYVAADGAPLLVIANGDELPSGTILIEERNFRELWQQGKNGFFRRMAERMGPTPLDKDALILPHYARSPNITAMKRL